jgi:hypothetical protein
LGTPKFKAYQFDKPFFCLVFMCGDLAFFQAVLRQHQPLINLNSSLKFNI